MQYSLFYFNTRKNWKDFVKPTKTFVYIIIVKSMYSFLRELGKVVVFQTHDILTLLTLHSFPGSTLTIITRNKTLISCLTFSTESVRKNW